MKEVRQEIVADHNGRPRGDCFKACLASILERDLAEVPHFVDIEAATGYHHLSLANGWLRQQGYPFILLARHFDQGPKPSLWYYLRATPHASRDKRQWVKRGVEIPGYWMMTVESKNFKDSHHVVVCRGDRIVWDPSPRFGQPEYDRRPYRFRGDVVTFHVENPHRIPRAT